MGATCCKEAPRVKRKVKRKPPPVVVIDPGSYVKISKEMKYRVTPTVWHSTGRLLEDNLDKTGTVLRVKSGWAFVRFKFVPQQAIDIISISINLPTAHLVLLPGRRDNLSPPASPTVQIPVIVSDSDNEKPNNEKDEKQLNGDELTNEKESNGEKEAAVEKLSNGIEPVESNKNNQPVDIEKPIDDKDSDKSVDLEEIAAAVPDGVSTSTDDSSFSPSASKDQSRTDTKVSTAGKSSPDFVEEELLEAVITTTNIPRP